ncbi:hypothetical protein [Pontibacillus salipaludis]|uniref:Lipoprotein n=1 Tax=Pontibacillus salipaludis TaxID=1697394 RepID=A0ABQ1PWF0_9BACI|nr:hypothetical protein [Pontibacillus salipaludis]GGD05114.1 hypothetical protein GCM10011389_10750 [Pontibacillus salipaludis]
MKRFAVLIFTCLLFMGAAACSNSETTESKQEDNPNKQSDDAETTTDSSADNPSDSASETQEGPLKEVGNISDYGNHKAELLAINSENHKLNQSSLKIEITSAKLLRIFDMSSQYRQDLQFYSNKDIGEEHYLIQLVYDVENTEASDITWNGLTDVVTDQKQQIDAIASDIMLTEADGQTDFLGNVKREYVDGFIVDSKDIQKLRLVFGYVYNKDMESIAEPTEQYIKF